MKTVANDWAGARTTYLYSAFQFSDDNAIKVRGSPRCGIEISNNVLPHPGFENDWGAAAVSLHPGAGILTVDRSGLRQFYAPLESRVGASPDWTSTVSH